ncbi:MAG TPA: UDP-N-acetylmuramoyl-L-alanine--D-glutamate ligase [Candidatus Limnocylindrales bacterium]|nr:UDP-N-acetylmuramoyl-L-alanine--D-glutamate ligase [Candidatus Limnocylindrales bacterium]
MTLDRPTLPGNPIDPDDLTLDAVRAGALRDRPVTVLGLARSGIALIRFLDRVGARVTAYDIRPRSELGRAIEAVGDGPHLLVGPDVDPELAWAGADLVTSSPSINPAFPTTEPRMRAALGALVERRARGDRTVPAVVWEPDLFLRLCPAPTVGITGTKGKTTTAWLTQATLAADPRHRAILGGNMGVPIVERLPDLTPDDRVVFELSELQLPTLSRGTTVAAYTNVTADHLDRHGSLAGYRRVKHLMAELVDPAGALILNADDPVVWSYRREARARVVRYGLDRAVPGGVGLEDGWIVARDVERLEIAGGGLAETGPGGRILPLDELAIPGKHNVSNAMAAIAAGLVFGVPAAIIRPAVRAFRGVEHRLELVAVIDGIRYVNDSQGTQPDAVAAALRAFEAPIVLIAGGRSKEVDLGALGPIVAERAAAAVLIGESAADLEGLFTRSGLRRIERAQTLEAAVDRATDLARELAGGRTATVLLSPAAASFDMFPDYEHRGRAFKAAVHALAERAG